ncbi:cation-translocating P-type ATPase [Magnetococcales bacterium HHB-1]
MDWHRLSLESIFEAVRSDEKGISSVEAEERVKLFGANVISDESFSPIGFIFWGQFKSFITRILLFAVIYSFLFERWIDALIILVIVLMNVLIGFFQEYSAWRSMEELKGRGGKGVRVLRDGVWRRMDEGRLTLGDVIELHQGDRIPADCRLMDSRGLLVDQSALVGKKGVVAKGVGSVVADQPLSEHFNMIYAGTAIVGGSCQGMVVEVGKDTQWSLSGGKRRAMGIEITPFQRRLGVFGRRLSMVVIVLCLLVFALSIWHGIGVQEWTFQSLSALAFIMVCLMVAVVPTSLPAVISVSLSVGVKRLLRKNSWVRHLSSVENLGGCNVICTDKTGTLTANRMSVVKAWSLDGEVSFSDGIEGEIDRLLFEIGYLCRQDLADSMERALGQAAERMGVSCQAQRIGGKPFDSDRKWMSVQLLGDRGEVIYVKGAPEKLLDCCDRVMVQGRIVTLDSVGREKIEDQIRHYGSQQMRVLGFAWKPVVDRQDSEEEGLIFVGLQALVDPPREEVKESLRKCRQAGIRVIMITGDSKETALALGRKIGLLGDVIDGSEFELMPDAVLLGALENGASIFARMSPHHKRRIVEALQRLDYVVAMTGDGVNDVPALEKADIGIALGSGDDVVREAADFVLLDNSFSHIVTAIEEGRGIHDNIQKSIILLLSGNLGELLLILFAVLFGLNLPLTAILLLWINMITDGAPALACSVDPYGKGIMKRQPRSPKEGIVSLSGILFITVLGVTGTVIAMGLFLLYGGYGDDPNRLLKAQTMVFNYVILYELILVFIVRRGHQVPFFANSWIWGTVFFSLILQLVVMMTSIRDLLGLVPITVKDVGVLLGAGAFFIMITLLYEMIARTVKSPPSHPLVRGV